VFAAFFVPHLNAAEAEDMLQKVKAHLRENGYNVTDERFYAVTYRHDGTKYLDKVGEPCGMAQGEEVLFIFDAGSVYLTCTPSRGVFRDIPVLIGKQWDTGATQFALAEKAGPLRELPKPQPPKPEPPKSNT
jgi:hypothetical protein